MVENVKPPSIPRYILFLLTLTGILIFIASTFSVVAAMGPAQAADGATVFKEKCVGCHTIGGGKLVGPDLAGVTERRTKEWLTKWISAPDQMLAAGDPTATELFNTYNKIAMPNLQLTPDQVAAVIAYIGSGETTTASSAVALPPGDANAGRAYFVGDLHFANGGPHCMSCHSISGVGSLGGGNLGPDLTINGYSKYGAGLPAFLASPATVTMNAVWKNTPLTPQEQADLFAFLQEASVSQRAPDTLLLIAGLAILGAAALIGLAQLRWSRRLKGVRKPMIERTLAAKKR